MKHLAHAVITTGAFFLPVLAFLVALWMGNAKSPEAPKGKEATTEQTADEKDSTEKIE